MADSSAPSPSTMVSTWGKVKQSFMGAVGDIVFGMEDGTVSIFGLVFGVAASSTSSGPVLLAGATGAVAAAVSMMAGAFLDVESSKGQARAELERERKEIEARPAEERTELAGRLRAAGFAEQDATGLSDIIARYPAAQLQFESAFELKLGRTAEENPFVHALWMFLADLFAASIPVIPFALFPIDTARFVSLGLTTLLLTLLGVGRALIARTHILRTTLETLAIAAIAATAGVLIGKLLGSSVSG